MNSKKQTYGLMTVITMIVGIVVGSGIYFKADDILSYTNGDTLLGLLVLGIGAISIIFGSLSFTELAKKTSTAGGMTGYFEEFLSAKVASGFGWFQTFIYLPSITAVVSWVSAIYTFSLLHIETTLEWQIVLGSVYVVVFATFNLLNKRFAGYFQNVSTAIKLLPLLTIAVIGLFWTKSSPALPVDAVVPKFNDNEWQWLSALVPLAFSYDGWIIALNIAPEVKNPLKNMTRALIIAPLIILVTYMFFFFGITRILGTDYILAVGNNATSEAIAQLFGNNISQFITVIITISILGVLNGMILSGMRLPQALAQKKMLRWQRLERINDKYQLSLVSSILFTGVSLLWLVLHYITQKFDVLAGRDVSEIAIVFNYLSYVLLYVVVLKLYFNKHIANKMTGIIAPILAILGSILIFVGSLLSSFTFVSIFVMTCFLFSMIGYYYYK